MQAEPLFKTAYGYLLLSLNKKDSAAIFFNDALNNTKNKNVDVLIAVAEANINSQAGDPALAISSMNNAIKREKKNEKLYVLLGDAYMKQNKIGRAHV